MTLGDYAKMATHHMNKKDFDFHSIEKRFHLADKPQVKTFCNLLLQNYVELDVTTGETIQMKLAPLVICMKLGQINLCFHKVYQI